MTICTSTVMPKSMAMGLVKGATKAQSKTEVKLCKCIIAAEVRGFSPFSVVYFLFYYFVCALKYIFAQHLYPLQEVFRAPLNFRPLTLAFSLFLFVLTSESHFASYIF